MKTLKFLFPNGIGTKVILAGVVLGVGLPMLDPAALKEIVLIVVTFLFSYKLMNGKPNGQ